jgi:hypothetical protein
MGNFSKSNIPPFFADETKGGWRKSLDAPIRITPIYASGLNFVCTEDGRLHAIE